MIQWSQYSESNRFTYRFQEYSSFVLTLTSLCFRVFIVPKQHLSMSTINGLTQRVCQPCEERRKMIMNTPSETYDEEWEKMCSLCKIMKTLASTYQH
ncbi:hypothetical protein MKW98_032074 [Papaver atlanticum]|uniref:Uncharacterized protein n=1 Tax=Papaver atlanticum TaxID=357466 RepID=A0AAD4XCF8_9MAGN|nr:hypothetical protein MKW98_032074 [Papaver atlanticum]